jgi:hypothetical protein
MRLNGYNVITSGHLIAREPELKRALDAEYPPFVHPDMVVPLS